jgi:hypothetical protein
LALYDELNNTTDDHCQCPIRKNDVGPTAIERIADGAFDDDLSEFARVQLDYLACPPLHPFAHCAKASTEIAIFALFDDLIDTSFDGGQFPVRKNDVEQTVVERIADGAFDDDLSEFARVRLDYLACPPRDPISYCTTESTETAILALYDELINTSFDHGQFPIRKNDVGLTAIEEIADGAFDDDLSEFARVRLDYLACPPRDPISYCTTESTETAIFTLFDELPLPLCPNSVRHEAFSDILHIDFFDKLQSISTTSLDSLHTLQLRDVRFHLGAISATGIAMEGCELLLGDLPLVSNRVSDEIVNEILDPVASGNLAEFAETDLRPLLSLDPIYRKLDFNFAPTAESFLPSDIPMTTNECLPRMVTAIASIYDPMDFYDFPLAVLNPLQKFVPPDEEWIDLDEFVDELLLLILGRDVLPFVPMHDDILLLPGTLNKILHPYASDTSCFSSLWDFPACALATINAKDIPVVVKPDDVVWRVLFAHVIPNMPLGPANPAPRMSIDELIEQILTDSV